MCVWCVCVCCVVLCILQARKCIWSVFSACLVKVFCFLCWKSFHDNYFLHMWPWISPIKHFYKFGKPTQKCQKLYIESSTLGRSVTLIEIKQENIPETIKLKERTTRYLKGSDQSRIINYVNFPTKWQLWAESQSSRWCNHLHYVQLAVDGLSRKSTATQKCTMEKKLSLFKTSPSLPQMEPIYQSHPNLLKCFCSCGQQPACV